MGQDEHRVHRVGQAGVGQEVSRSGSQGVKGLVHRCQQEGEEDEKSQQDKEASEDELEGPEDENDPVEEGFGGLLKLMPRPGKNQVWVTCESFFLLFFTNYICLERANQ